MKLRAYLVDDESLAIERLKRLLQESGRVEVIGSATESEPAIEALRSTPADVCFLDIHLPRLNGFEILARLERAPAIVFTTAYDQYALQAFAANATDYLLKPVDPAHLARALHKVETSVRNGSAHAPDLRELVRQLTDTWRKDVPPFPDRIASRLGDRITFLDLTQVSHFYAEDKLTFAAAAGKAHCVDHTIAALEQLLDPRHFVRIHRGTLVNISWIRDLASLPGGHMQVRLKDAKGTELDVARDRVRELKAKFV